jgi:hypothetical protein
MSDCLARTRIYPLRATLECLFDESSTNARLEPVIKTVLFAIAMLFLLSYFDLSFRHLLCRRLTRPWFGMVFLNQFESPRHIGATVGH